MTGVNIDSRLLAFINRVAKEVEEWPGWMKGKADPVVSGPRFKMPPKPRLPFCWWCSRRLYGTISETIVVDGLERIVHKACARAAEREGK